MNERSILKVDLQVAERKLQKSMQRQQLLEKKYEQQRHKNEQLEKILIELRNDLISTPADQEMWADRLAPVLNAALADLR